MAHSVNISVEAPIENQIHEITYDGQEIYQAPLTLSENLTKLAQKIDFSVTTSDENVASASIKREYPDTNSIDVKPSIEDSKGPGQSLWPWDSVRNKLRNALTEVCVLADVLAIAKEKRHMVLDRITEEPKDSQPIVLVYGRKKALATAAHTLLAAAERIRTNENTRNARRTNDFHLDLLKLRQNWRIKKVSNAIIGDLSYKTAGSTYPQSGYFEVSKAPDDVPHSRMNAANMYPSLLRVKIPAELQGFSMISVVCQKDQEELLSTQITAGAVGIAAAAAAAAANSSISELDWQKKLDAAQNVLFCKELFARLASEAVQLNAPIPHMVVGNQIVATVLPGIQLIIGLYHSNAKNVPLEGKSKAKSKSDHHVLEHSLHQLLRETHHTNTHHPFPHPASGPLGLSKRRCLAGPLAADRYELLEMSKQQTLLEQILQQAQHFFMRRRTEYVLDTIAKEVKDPLIISHWNTHNSPTMSCVKINIMTHRYDTICRTSLVIHVGEKTLKCICRDGRVMNMSYEPQELRDLIYCQIYQHQMAALQALGRCMGWQFLASSGHLGSGPVESLGNALSCLLASPNGDRMISVRCEPSSGIKVSIAQSPRKDFFAGQLVQERKWEHLGGSFNEVHFDKMEGKTFLNKMELLMASLSSSSSF